MASYESVDDMDYDSEVYEYSDDDMEDPGSDSGVQSQPDKGKDTAADEDGTTQDYGETYDFDDDDEFFGMDDSGFEPVISSRDQRKPWEVEFHVHDAQGLHNKQEAMINRLVPVLSVSKDITTILLRSCQWKEESLVERYLTNPDKTILEAGMFPNASAPEAKAGNDDFTCEVCFSTGAEEEYLGLACGHAFCTTCYVMYLTGKILEGMSWRIHCPAPKCKALVGEQAARLLLADESKILERYEDNLTRSFVNDLDSFTWCPAPNCEYGIECHVPKSAWTTVVPTVHCRCGQAFCFGCSLDDHMPAPCFLVDKWLQKCKDDSETSNWLKANTKECTQCKATIEKNGGCNHMTCRKCAHEFCWVCMGPWSEHQQAYYQCNRFNEDSSKNARDSISKSRALLERYLHYYSRYSNHERSAKLTVRLLNATETNMEQMQLNSSLSWIEVQFLSAAVDMLSICRATLKWSYVLAYYMEADNQKLIFENNQSDLEMATEHLNELVDNPVNGRTIEEAKRLIIDKTQYVKTRWETLLRDTAQGLQENRWKFQD